MALNSFADVQAFINQVLQNNGVDASGAPHGDFWSTTTGLTYEQFTKGPVPGVDPPVPILAVGKSQESNIIQALQGVGPLFNNNDGTYQQMPFGGPYFTSDQIAEIAAWIDNGCPQ